MPAGVEILKPIPAALADLQVGKRVLARGVPGADGVLVAASVNIVGNPPQLAQ